MFWLVDGLGVAVDAVNIKGLDDWGVGDGDCWAKIGVGVGNITKYVTHKTSSIYLSKMSITPYIHIFVSILPATFLTILLYVCFSLPIYKFDNPPKCKNRAKGMAEPNF